MKAKLKKFLESLIQVNVDLLFLLISLFHINKDNFAATYLTGKCKSIEKKTSTFLSFRMRPKYTEKTITLPDRHSYSQYAIVMQGPILKENDFTYETIKYYKKLYPDIVLILSTWVDEDVSTLERIKELGAEVILSEYPSNSGRLNINYQIVNTRAGVTRAHDLGIKYTCKTRTDQRIYSLEAMDFMSNLVNSFKPVNSDFKKPQKGRIVGLCMNYGDMFYPYCLSDFLYFGYTEDILELFLLDFDDRDKGQWAENVSYKFISENMLAPEVQIIRNYIRRMGGDCSVSIKNYWEFVKNHMVCINKDQIELYWPKYDSRYSENQRNGYYHLSGSGLKQYNFNFNNWFNLFCGSLTYNEAYEKFAERIFE